MKSFKILGLDPGNELTGIVYLRLTRSNDIANSKVIFSGHLPNDEVLKFLDNSKNKFTNSYIEMIEGRGNVVGASVFETLFWTGRFYEAILRQLREFDSPPERFYPRHIWNYIAGRPNASDKNIRNGLVDKYGEQFQFTNSHERAAMAVLGYGFDRFVAGERV